MSNDLADALGLKYPSFFWVIDSRFFCIIDSRFFCSRYCCIAFGEMGYRGLLQAKPGGRKGFVSIQAKDIICFDKWRGIAHFELNIIPPRIH